ncbi:PREDICTED: senescence-associated carboxylesterase 101-like [Fragaria vesca subsp. vesca]|uniref:senescence-associated carboxylesterase 101-like n=1 Tax=Fragaria vesca subsp. vesca TaxID=101020 RepID=UPI0002C3189F|nr:PREDICTED: senescence-associated carboxylesterase 101-like [Fragaria vesca subsp. vesca]
MVSQNKFSSGLESGNFVLNSDPVNRAWCAVEQQRQINPNAEPLYNEIIQPENQIIIAFGTPPSSLEGQEGLVSSKYFPHFEFLCNKSNPVFYINEAAITLFQSHYDDLLLLKNKLVENSKSKTPPLIIITGQYVGGIVATLFTLWLLEGFNVLKTKRPLCVTFSSPFVGDEHLRKCVLEFSTWKSCFLHVVSDQDHTPKLFMSRNTFGAYKPFGTFLLCSTSGSATSEDPDFISEQFVTANSLSAQTQDPNLGFPYGHILEDLKRKALCNVYKSIGGERDPLEASIITQLLAVGVVSQQQSPDTNNLVGKMKKHETKLLIQKMKNSDNDKRLNDMKICMANLEWYKKDSKRQNIGYYDRYREKGNESDINVNGYKKKLMNYWEDSVTEVENKPQMEGAHFRVRWLWGGTNYRRMVEPLHIADYYKDGGKNYISDGKRPKHFILLEEWLKKKDKPQEVPSKAKRESVGASLNEDSCFWAHVEEARILCTLVKNGSVEEKERAPQELKIFEAYVYGSLKNYALSPEIFLEKSSFMQWLKEYKGVVEQPYSSLLLDFMKERNHEAYQKGEFIFP